VRNRRSISPATLALRPTPPKNNVMKSITIYPYRLGNCWVFDDARTGLKEEAFVLGSSEIMARLVEAKGIPQAEKGFALTFSDEPFEGHDAELSWLRSDDSQVLSGKDGSASQISGNGYGRGCR
jgi:hypothetical protein